MILVIQYREEGAFIIFLPSGVKGNQVNIPGPATEFHHVRVICAVTLASMEKSVVVLGRVFFSLLRCTAPLPVCPAQGVPYL